MAAKSSNVRFFKTANHELVQLSTIEKFLIRPGAAFTKEAYEIVGCPKGNITAPIVARFNSKAAAEAGMEQFSAQIADPGKLVIELGSAEEFCVAQTDLGTGRCLFVSALASKEAAENLARTMGDGAQVVTADEGRALKRAMV